MIRPSFYDKFNCIADKCEFTCCQEWKIAVDDNTLEDWKNIDDTDVMDEKPEKVNRLSYHVCQKDTGNVITLNDNGKCPFLNQEGLCNIVLKYGEEAISDTCHVFPREEKEFSNHTEKTLMLCCPHVIDMLNAEERFNLIDKQVNQSALFELRHAIIDYIQRDKKIPLEGKLLIIFYILLESYEKDEYDSKLWLLEPELVNTINQIEKDAFDTLNERNELMLDLIDNYLKEGIYLDYLLPLNEEALEIEMQVEKDGDISEEERTIIKEFDDCWESYGDFLSKILAHEIFGELIIDEEDIESVLVKYQWIIMEYSLARHFSYLHFRKKKELKYQDIKQYIVIAFRIMGFDDDDIYEYLENSFEDLVWDWRYMALLI